MEIIDYKIRKIKPDDVLKLHRVYLSAWLDTYPNEEFNITTCMECGTCTFTCPANIPLVQWIRLGKQKVNELQREKK